MFRCVPYCETCIHGVCVAPRDCKCNTNYEKDENGLCVPICSEKCKNADCILPNICSCHPGYEPDPNKNNTCNPVCGTTCDQNGFCSAPNTCECNPGYKTNGVLCSPVCNICEYGRCESPGSCVCELGFQHTVITINDVVGIRCDPICDPACINGTCSTPNYCQCNEGYGYNPEMAHICEPLCEQPCINGDCISHNVCSCHMGFVTESEFKCVPECVDCVFGKCVAPGQCECQDGYNHEGKSDKCVPICEPKCINSVCTLPGVCSCHDGYKIIGNESYSCNPVCLTDCGPGGKCIGPNLCNCDHGKFLEILDEIEFLIYVDV